MERERDRGSLEVWIIFYFNFKVCYFVFLMISEFLRVIEDCRIYSYVYFGFCLSRILIVV